MAAKHHPTPLSGGDRKALSKELSKSAGIERMLAVEAAELRTRGEAQIQKADNLDCQSWNERMWRAGEPIDPSPTVEQAINGGFPWIEIKCSRCHTKRDVDLAALKTPSTTFVHDLSTRLRCTRCSTVGKRPAATLLQLEPRPRHKAAKETE